MYIIQFLLTFGLILMAFLLTAVGVIRELSGGKWTAIKICTGVYAAFLWSVMLIASLSHYFKFSVGAALYESGLATLLGLAALASPMPFILVFCSMLAASRIHGRAPAVAAT